MNELAAKLKRLEDAHNDVYWNAEQRREVMDAIFAEEPVVSLKEVEAAAGRAGFVEGYGSAWSEAFGLEKPQFLSAHKADQYAAKIRGG